jgi:uncharacterized protein
MPLDYVIQVCGALTPTQAAAWDDLLQAQDNPSPVMRHAYLHALHASASACTATGWTPHFFVLTHAGQLHAACLVYVKTHSYGEYVFDWAWADAYARHGLDYYPKAVIAVPFTPVPSARLLAVDATARAALLQAVGAWCKDEGMSSLHLLFGSAQDIAACEGMGMMLRQTVQFHWKNVAPTLAAARAALPPEGARFALGRPGGETVAPTLAAARAALPPEGARFASFEDFLATLSQDKRKKIRQERRKVQAAGIVFRCAEGHQITRTDWDFFYRCYETTYLHHGNPPYLTRDFFQRMSDSLSEAWVMFIAERDGHPVATSLIAVEAINTPARGIFWHENGQNPALRPSVAYGRYWGTLEPVDCLHFEACYYQPLQWCIARGVDRFEGGAQGEHKMARALMPVTTHSAHWLAHPSFADAVARFLEREGQGVQHYLDELGERSPFKSTLH